jgi:sigma-B regulation protein RsbU (phosphoserine phosphatase)
MGFSIRTKLIVAIGVPLVVAYLAMVWLEYRLGRQEAVAHMESHLGELASRQAAELNGDLASAEAVASTIAILLTRSHDTSLDRIQDLLQDALGASPGIFGMSAAFEPFALSRTKRGCAPYYCRAPGGGLRYIDIAAAQPNYVDLTWYRQTRSTRREAWSEPYFDRGVSDRLMCTYSAPIFHHGSLRGVVTADLLSTDLLDDLARVNIGRGYCFLISSQGAFISHPDPTLVMHESIFGLARKRGLPDLEAAGREMVAGRTGICRVHDYRSGESKWIVFAPVPAAGWSLGAVLQEREVMAPVRARATRSLRLFGACLAVIVGIVILVSGRVLRPVARLTEAAERLAHGDLDVQIRDASGRDEMGRLARTFNRMVADLKTSVDARIRQEAARQEVEGELNAAREVQASLLPNALQTDTDAGDRFTLSAVNLPAKTVAGDFFDFFFVDPRRLAIVMADVSGKGIPAAVFMAVARTKLRDFAAADKSPAQVVAEVNRSLARENERAMFVTLFFGYYDTHTGELLYVNAGHNPPYLVRRSAGWETLQPTGPLVGPFREATYREARCRLEPDDLLLLYTDGVTEANCGDGDLFGEPRLEQILQLAPGLSPATLCETITAAVRDFSRGDLQDDVTLLSLRRAVAHVEAVARIEEHAEA